MLSDYYLYLKSFHLIFMVSWFAGLFYLPRIFIYYTEADLKKEPDKTILQKQFLIMAKRLQYIIATPAMYITLVFGILLIFANPDVMHGGWFHAKLTVILVLFWYHFKNTRVIKKFEKGELSMSSEKFRAYNEIPTLCLFAIIFLVVLKNMISMAFAFAGMFVLALLLMIGIRVYKKLRKDY